MGELWGTDPPHLSRYKGVKLFNFPIKPFRRVFYETIYNIFSLARASVTCDSVLMLGHGTGFFFFIPKLLRKKLSVNMDGKEWQREKYNTLEKAALWVNERFALFYADRVVADSRHSCISSITRSHRGLHPIRRRLSARPKSGR